MEDLAKYFTQYYIYYIIAAVLILPPLVIFRRYSAPIIQFLIELLLVSSGAHIVFHVAVGLISSFTNASSMELAFAKEVKNKVDWQTPLVAIWDRTLYNPPALFYAEWVILAVLLALMWKFRAIRIKPMKKKLPPPKKKPVYDYSGKK